VHAHEPGPGARGEQARGHRAAEPPRGRRVDVAREERLAARPHGHQARPERPERPEPAQERVRLRRVLVEAEPRVDHRPRPRQPRRLGPLERAPELGAHLARHVGVARLGVGRVAAHCAHRPAAVHHQQPSPRPGRRARQALVAEARHVVDDRRPLAQRPLGHQRRRRVDRRARAQLARHVAHRAEHPPALLGRVDRARARPRRLAPHVDHVGPLAHQLVGPRPPLRLGRVPPPVAERVGRHVQHAHDERPPLVSGARAQGRQGIHARKATSTGAP
jgi:hypothetical protein